MSALTAAYAVLMLSGCGFHLRGQGPDATTVREEFASLRVHLVNSQDNQLQVEMERALREQGGVRLIADGVKAAATLTLYNARSETRASAVGATARVSQFLVRYELAFDVKDATGHELLDRQSISLQQAFTFDRLNVLAMEREAQEISAQLRSRAMQQIIRQLAVRQ